MGFWGLLGEVKRVEESVAHADEVTGWTVFVNLLEPSQYSPVASFLHALNVDCPSLKNGPLLSFRPKSRCVFLTL